MKRLFPVLCLLSSLIAARSFAGSATWNLNPTNSDWNTAANWTPETVPSSESDIATFGVSNNTEVSLSNGIFIDRINFSSSASAFTINTNRQYMVFGGGGIINNSANIENFLLEAFGDDGAAIVFINDAAAGTNTSFTVLPGAEVNFFDNSSAERASFVLNGGGIGAGRREGGTVTFYNDSSADQASFVLNGGQGNSHAGAGELSFRDTSNAGLANIVCESSGDYGGLLAAASFFDQSSAANATIIALGATKNNPWQGFAIFTDTSSAGNATLIAKGSPDAISGGEIHFDGSSTGGAASVKLIGKGLLYNFTYPPTSVTIGSLEGDGQVNAVSKGLTVGSNNRNTTFSGQIISGPLTKIGKGTLTLAGSSPYTAGTTVEDGRLLTNNSEGSATGTGPVQVNHGTFGGNGTVSGAVTIGNGTDHGAVLAPGISRIGRLTLTNTLTFKTNSQYNWNVDGIGGTADETLANGVTIEAGALFFASGRGNVSLPLGTVFTAISNTSATSIAGVFDNLPDGSVLIVGPSHLQASYEGGDGNDLTLTVVP